jgi:hypothetical protein
MRIILKDKVFKADRFWTHDTMMLKDVREDNVKDVSTYFRF